MVLIGYELMQCLLNDKRRKETHSYLDSVGWVYYTCGFQLLLPKVGLPHEEVISHKEDFIRMGLKCL